MGALIGYSGSLSYNLFVQDLIVRTCTLHNRPKEKEFPHFFPWRKLTTYVRLVLRLSGIVAQFGM